MFGCRDKRVTVRFTDKEAATFEQLFSTPGLFSYYRKPTWTNLIHMALKDMHDKYVKQPAAKLSDSPAGASDKPGRSRKAAADTKALRRVKR